MSRMTAIENGRERETHMLLDLLDAATGMKCSLAWGAGGVWQIMDEGSAGGESSKFFWWQLKRYPNAQWYDTPLEAAHAYLEKYQTWRDERHDV